MNGGRGIINHVYVDNLIDGIFRAVEQEAYGEVFNITDGGQTTFREYFDRLAEIGRMPRPRSLPKPVMRTGARLIQWWQSLRNREPDLMPEAVEFIDRPHVVSIEKARRQLDYEPRIDLDEGLRRTAEWLLKESFISS